MFPNLFRWKPLSEKDAKDPFLNIVALINGLILVGIFVVVFFVPLFMR